MKRLLILFFIIIVPYYCNAQQFSRNYEKITIVKDGTIIKHNTHTKVYVNYNKKNQILINSAKNQIIFKYMSPPKSIVTNYGKAQELYISDKEGKLFKLTLYESALIGVILNDGITEISYHNIQE